MSTTAMSYLTALKGKTVSVLPAKRDELLFEAQLVEFSDTVCIFKKDGQILVMPWVHIEKLTSKSQ